MNTLRPTLGHQQLNCRKLECHSHDNFLILILIIHMADSWTYGADKDFSSFYSSSLYITFANVYDYLYILCHPPGDPLGCYTRFFLFRFSAFIAHWRSRILIRTRLTILPNILISGTTYKWIFDHYCEPNCITICVYLCISLLRFSLLSIVYNGAHMGFHPPAFNKWLLTIDYYFCCCGSAALFEALVLHGISRVILQFIPSLSI